MSVGNPNFHNYTLTEPTSTALSVVQKDVIIHIHRNGKIEFYGPVDDAAEEFLKALGLRIDKNHCGERIAKEAFYKKIHGIMDNIEGMTKEEIISYLQEMEADAHKSLTWAVLNEKEFE